jgi:O-antigen ligase
MQTGQDAHSNADTGPARGVGRWLSTGLIEPRRAQAAFDRQRGRDPRGDRLHLWCMAPALVLVSGPTSIAEFALGPVLVFAVLRLWATWRTTGWGFRQPATLACLAFAVWMLASVLWSPDRAKGLSEVSRLRWLIWIPLVYPIIGRRGAMIAMLAAGFLLVNTAQVWHAIGLRFDVEWMTFDRLPHRNAAWFDPAVGGSVMMVPLGLHLGGLVFGRGRWRAVGAGGALITSVGILATGTRGAWLAGAALLAVAMVVMIARLPSGRVRLATAATIVGVGLIGAAVSWAVLGPTISARAANGVEEVSRALRDKDYASYTGSRIAMSLWAGEAFVEHPIAGRGAGGFRTIMEERVEAESLGGVVLASHAHNMYMHVAATGGLVGLSLAGVGLVTVFVGACRPRFGVELARPPTDPTGYHTGPALALLGLAFVAAFDSLHVNTPTAAVLGVLIALCPGWRPSGT